MTSYIRSYIDNPDKQFESGETLANTALTLIKYLFWQIIAKNLKVVYTCINDSAANQGYVALYFIDVKGKACCRNAMSFLVIKSYIAKNDIIFKNT